MKPTIVILAGGAGRRIGGGKPQRLLAGRALIDRALGLARGWSDDVRIAGPGGDLADAPDIAGPLGGLVAALGLGREILTIPCDMPFLPEDLPARLVGDAAAIVAMSHGRLHPVCGLWRPAARDGLDAYLATGRRSLHGFAEAVGYQAVEWDIDPIDPFFNVNDEADLARAEAVFKNR